MPGRVRPATLADVPTLIELAAQKRLEYQQHQPQFWREAADAREKQTPYFERQVASDQTITLVYEEDAELRGFLIATLIPAPPVYYPGGLTCLVDDFTVAAPAECPAAGPALLAAAGRAAKARGAVQTVVVCAHLDEIKRAMLTSSGYSIASEWYVRPID